MNKGYYITSTGDKVILEPKDVIDVTNKDIIELFIPDGAKWVHCDNNKLTKLDIPSSVKWIYCIENNLTELIVPDHCEVYGNPDCNIITRTMYNRSNRLKTILK